ncbi:MAG: SUMF1/EgtB/PvdO family nonheme iron enzyme [Deltaproteobacteria bacterium]|nr:SUMF1/EgtB/PvdO family nonheme iron enzyme [Deltaproteobacteria bacterium]
MGLLDYSFWDNYKNTIEALSGGRNTVIFDDVDLPSVMVRIPKFNVEDIDALLGTGVHPAFIVGGAEKTHFAVGKYLAYEYNSRAYSLPFKDPKTSIDFDDSRSRCTAKGTGWHLLSNWEWAAIVLLCLKNSFQPRGNTNYGRHHAETYETAIRQDGLAPGESGTARTLTGTGPNTWNHDNSPLGISDMTGNVWKWVDGMKLVGGKFYMPNDNDYSLAEASWVDQGVIVADDGGVAKLGDAALDTLYATGSVSFGAWKGLTTTANYDALAEATRQRMFQACIDPYNTTDPVGNFWFNTDGERVPRRGGGWDNAGAAGPCALRLSSVRSYVDTSFGFVPAFIS